MNPSPKKTFCVGTRGSPLALRQTELLITALRSQREDLDVQVKTITTSGDRITDRFLTNEGGKGLFVKEIEEALIEGSIDFAVHSCKDLPAETPSGLSLISFPQRDSYADVLVTLLGETLEELPQEAVVGTTSLRRRAQLLQKRPDLKMELLRGNINTRLRRLREGHFDAIVLAEAGMNRLGLDAKAQILSMVPAPGQGALALEVRADDEATASLLKTLHHESTAQAVSIERQVMAALGGDCHLPLGALAQEKRGQWDLSVFVGLPDGSQVIEVNQRAPIESSEKLVEDVIATMEKRGAREIMDRCGEWLE